MSGWGQAEKEEKKRNNIRRGETHRSHLCFRLLCFEFLFVFRPVIDWLVGVCYSFYSDWSCSAAFIRSGKTLEKTIIRI